MNSAGSLAAFVGASGQAPGAVPREGAWREAVTRLASRHAGPLSQGHWNGGKWAFRGHRDSHRDGDQSVVFVDGHIDNLAELDFDGGQQDDGIPPTGVERLARLYAAQGNDLFVRLSGNYSIAIVTPHRNEVLLVRDRYGTRPLFYAKSGSGWAWGSEVKLLCPLMAQPGIDAEGVRQAIQFRYILGPTLVDGITQVTPASHVQLRDGVPARETRYWKLQFTPDAATASQDDWADRVDTALSASLARVQQSNRDVGILLSGGVDSSILALKAAKSGFRNCIAYTARWKGENPELDSAIRVARQLGMEHEVVDVDDSYLAAAYPWLVSRMEEPPRHYNSFVLARLFQAAASRVTTLLSGHAADGLFGPVELVEIDRFREMQRVLGPVPRALRTALSRALPADSSRRFARWRRYLRADERALVSSFSAIDYGGLGAALFGARALDRGHDAGTFERFYSAEKPITERFQRFDVYTFLQSHMRVFDRCGTPHGVSVSMPFMDPHVINVAKHLPASFKRDGATAKPILKRLAARHFPREWVYQSKQGFPTDTARWLDGPLGRWRGLLDEPRTAARGLFHPPALRSAEVTRHFEAIWTAMTLETACRQLFEGESMPHPPHG